MKVIALSFLPRSQGPVLTGLLFLGVMLGAAACKKAAFAPISPDGGVDAPKDGARDTAADAPADLPPASTCPPEVPSRSKSRADPCSCDRECQTGYCVDGVCCTSACGETCKACNLASSPGECAFVPAGGRPNDSQVCAASTPGTCGQDGTCDGKGGCRKYVIETECKAGICDGDTVKNFLVCDGEGNCTLPRSHPCPPYGCDSKTNHCATTCTTDGDCADGQQCLAGSCGKSVNGEACTDPGRCASGFCVDGVCCNTACSGPCVSCAETGTRGHCTYVTTGLPDPACVASERSSCGQNGLCDGSGNCTLYPANTVCGPSSCSGLLEDTPRTCDGRGICRESQLLDCAPFLCSNGGCETSCDPSGKDVCAPGIVCAAPLASGSHLGSCGKRQQGQPCSTDDDCDSGVCADGVCCENRCAGPCRSCALPNSPGQCVNVAAGATDPHGTCVDRGAAACGTDGVCDGQGACRTYPAGTECGRQSCVTGVHSPPSTCNASGQCVASRSISCGPFLCNGDVCFSACTSNNQCVTGNFCVNGSCGLKPNGAECGAGSECQSSFCAQGVCCDRACTAPCMACNLTATLGQCTAVADRAPDPQGKCVVTQGASCGTTGTCVKGACAVYDRGLGCKAAVCASASSVTPASSCDGLGSCVTPAEQPCGAFACAAGTCKSSCTTATEAQDCVPPNTCVNGSCGRKLNGTACTSAGQCLSGFCTEGVCCESACTDATTGGLCKTCKGTTGSPAGTCANVAAGSADPKSRCVKTNAAGGDCANDGTCNGAGACRPWSSTTGCRQESCVGSMHTLPATCDGKGGCPAATVVSCGSYMCSGATSPTCLNTCSSNADCTGGLTCLMTTHHCGTKLAAGDTCVATSDCDTGLVCGSEGVCCDQACTSGCQSCKLAGKAGVCSNITSGSAPRTTSPVTCPAAGTDLCGNSGLCDSSGGCEQRSSCAVNNTVCPVDLHTHYSATGVCSAGTCTPQTTSCTQGYLCIAGGGCATNCTAANASTNCDTANGYTCIINGSSGACQKRVNSTACTAANQCQSGNCVDGYCCDSACNTTCQSCNVATHEGTCWNVSQNSPDQGCPGACPQPNQATGLCDGAGHCNGATTCATGYLCVAGVCGSACATGADCAPGYTCAADKTCKKSNGQPCGAPGECATGYCVDGYCCGSACATDCSSCNVTNSLGTCTPVPNGTADGNCIATCNDYLYGGLCDGHGSCRPATTPCPNGYPCGPNAQCATSCLATCAPNYYCLGGACLSQKANGQACAGAPGECTSGFCVDGYCCNSACNTPCQSCNLSGHEGTCWNVPADSTDNGTCPGSCPSATQASGLCDGSGNCRGVSSCAPYFCAAGTCRTSCTTGADCATGFYCAGTTCATLKANSESCTAGLECTSGVCISDGTSSICCSAGCTDVTCGTAALCNTNGVGCQTHAPGSACTAGDATCAADGHGSLAATGTCVGSACQPTRTDCTTGYLCVGSACVEPGHCSPTSGCDTANSYACNPDTLNCEFQPS